MKLYTGKEKNCEIQCESREGTLIFFTSFFFFWFSIIDHIFQDTLPLLESEGDDSDEEQVSKPKNVVFFW